MELKSCTYLPNWDLPYLVCHNDYILHEVLWKHYVPIIYVLILQKYPSFVIILHIANIVGYMQILYMSYFFPRQ